MLESLIGKKEISELRKTTVRKSSRIKKKKQK